MLAELDATEAARARRARRNARNKDRKKRARRSHAEGGRTRRVSSWAPPVPLDIKAGPAKVTAGRFLKLAAKVVNHGTAPLSNLGIRFSLPQGSTLAKATVSPRPKLLRTPITTDDGTAYLKGLTVKPGKALTVRIKLRLDHCTPVGALPVPVMAYVTNAQGVVTCTTPVKSATVS